MREIEFSVMSNDPTHIAQKFAPLIETFQQKTNIRVRLLVIDWRDGWQQVINFGLYGKGPDVSEVGTTWVGSLASMGALRPFSLSQLESLGGESAFFAPSWQVNFLYGDRNVWGVPWLADILLIYYYKDALAKAGIEDARAAFANPITMGQALSALQKAGYEYPLSMVMHNTNRLIHIAANWIWNSGGDLMTSDGKQAIFAEPKALQGFQDYFALRPYISPNIQRSHVDFFQNKQAAIMIDGPRYDVIGRQNNPNWRKQIGLAPLFEKTWVGGMNFVVWKHSRMSDESFAWIHFLSTQTARNKYKLHDVNLYAHRDSFAAPSGEDDVYQKTCEYALLNGRSFLPTVQGWGMIEDRLDKAIVNVWTELYASPDAPADPIIRKHIELLARRLNAGLNPT